MKFRAHETFYVRKGWLSKGMKNVIENPDVFVSKDKLRNPMDVLGIGANMVKALRYWMQATGLSQEPKSGIRTQGLTDLGKLVYQYDRYTEEPGTLLLLHYKLASNPDMATSWYFFFNEFTMSEFTKEDYIQAIQNYVLMQNQSTALRSLEDDFTCLINTYSGKKTTEKNVSPENNLDCPFQELGLVKQTNLPGKETVYRKCSPQSNRINPWVALSVICEQADGKTEISLNSLLQDKGNLGRIFNLDSTGLLDLLYKTEKTGALKIIRTSGLDYIRLLKSYTFKDCVERYYQEITQEAAE